MIKEDLVMLDLNNFMIQGKEYYWTLSFVADSESLLNYGRSHSIKYKTCKEKERESERDWEYMCVSYILMKESFAQHTEKRKTNVCQTRITSIIYVREKNWFIWGIHTGTRCWTKIIRLSQ